MISAPPDFLKGTVCKASRCAKVKAWPAPHTQRHTASMADEMYIYSAFSHSKDKTNGSIDSHTLMHERLHTHTQAQSDFFSADIATAAYMCILPELIFQTLLWTRAWISWTACLNNRWASDPHVCVKDSLRYSPQDQYYLCSRLDLLVDWENHIKMLHIKYLQDLQETSWGKTMHILQKKKRKTCFDTNCCGTYQAQLCGIVPHSSWSFLSPVATMIPGAEFLVVMVPDK